MEGAGQGEEDLGEWREQGRERKTWVSAGSREQGWEGQVVSSRCGVILTGMTDISRSLGR